MKKREEKREETRIEIHIPTSFSYSRETPMVGIVHTLQNLGYSIPEDFSTSYGLIKHSYIRMTIYIQNNKMTQDPKVREFLLEYLI